MLFSMVRKVWALTRCKTNIRRRTCHTSSSDYIMIKHMLFFYSCACFSPVNTRLVYTSHDSLVSYILAHDHKDCINKHSNKNHDTPKTSHFDTQQIEAFGSNKIVLLEKGVNTLGCLAVIFPPTSIAMENPIFFPGKIPSEWWIFQPAMLDSWRVTRGRWRWISPQTRQWKQQKTSRNHKLAALLVDSQSQTNYWKPGNLCVTVIKKMVVMLGWGPLNNQPHIHLI